VSNVLSVTSWQRFKPFSKQIWASLVKHSAAMTPEVLKEHLGARPGREASRLRPNQHTYLGRMTRNANQPANASATPADANIN
jgi:hypothetical protein